jgi:PIF1-like helicase/Helitron helicase-like domain at N-terminus
MPPKRTTSLGRSTSASRRMAASRAAETPEQTRTRLANQSTRQAASRAAETPEQGQARREEDRARHAASRAAETPKQRRTRSEDQRRRQAASRAARWTFMEREAFRYDPSNNYDNHPQVCIGQMSDVCPYCDALKWPGETRGMCCSGGKVKLPPLRPPPEPLESLMSGIAPESKHFLDNIRKYNSCFQMTSFGTSKEVVDSGFMPTFRVQGQVHHRLGSLLPPSNEEHKFLQIYFMGDDRKEVQQRCKNMPGVRENIVKKLQQMVHEHNPYVQFFKTALQRMPSDQFKVVIRADKKPAGEHARRFNEPVTNEVAAVIAGNEFDKRDIVLEKQNGQLQRVSETHRSYDALQYPLIFCEGEDGYDISIAQTDPKTGLTVDRKTVSAMDFYAYRIMVRFGAVNHILRCRQLFHQFVVDMYAKIESERLSYLRYHQKTLRVDEYIHLRDAIANDGNASNLGQLVILPSTFTGSPRHMHEYTQDAMTYVRNYGRPDLFVTFTCNPKWEDIQEELLFGQAPSDRHDLLARVFRQKLIKLINIVTKSHVFGPTRCWMYSIEWQKRGLPHAHILIWLKDKIKSEQIDSVIRAELPDPQQDPRLFEIVIKTMIHGPCGAINPQSPCMENNKCTKRYPRQLLGNTETGDDGYPLYRRRSPEDGGIKAKIKMRIGNSIQEIEIDNKWVVPYCPLLSRIFQAHINVEYCNSVKSIKYICKYVNKGSDQAVFGLERDGTAVDEIKQYQLGRYISSNEAVWRILDFPIHERYPTVVHLAVHLENGQRVYFTEDNVHERVNEPPRTTLTAFFLLCQKDDFAKTLLYCDVPKYYTWDASGKIFKRRVQGTAVPGYPNVRESEALGRVYTVHPNNFECFFLRLLLYTVRGPTSFEALRTVNGRICATFREACQLHGLLEDDQQWDATMSEAAAAQSPARLRNLFALILTTCGPSNPKQLWESYKESLTEDILREARRQNPGMNLHYTPIMFNQVLLILEDKTLQMADKNLEKFGLPTPQRNRGDRLSSEMLRETSYDVKELDAYVAANEPLLVPDQRAAYNAILGQIKEKAGGIIFLDAPGGTGKTFVINLLLAKIRKESKIAIAVASSGIAATLLQGGRTAHSTLKLPFKFMHDEHHLCSIRKGTGEAKILEICELIVWDECTMAHRYALEALNNTLQDLRGNGKNMGGIVVLLAGDFRQTLPVIQKGTMADELKACLKSSYLWRHVKSLTLSTNMRVHLQGNVSAGQFAEQLLAIGNGKIPVDPANGLISISGNFCNVVGSVEELKSSVFPNIRTHFKDHKWLCERAILAPKNVNVNAINLQIQEQLPGETTLYKSIDTVTDADAAVQYPIEFLNSLEPSGMPPHNLRLKIGSSIMLLRNLDAPRLCNGIRLCVKTLMPHVIEATIMTGCAKGEDVFIPRIPLLPSDMPFEFKRLQFPVRLAFAMSINKAQGQSLKVAGVNLETPCFSHGQLYVACSRVGTGKNLYVFAPNGKTKNVVYQTALQ